MSTQEIAALIDSVNDMTKTVADKTKEIDQKVDEATGAVPDTVKALFNQTIYVHPITGSDSNDGKTSAKPLKSIYTAVMKIPNGGYGRIELLSDMESLNGGLLPPNVYQRVAVGSRQVFLDLNGFTWNVKTVAKNGWQGESDTTVSLTTTFGCSANGSMTVYNGRISIKYLPEHVGKPLYIHVQHNSLIMADSCRLSLTTLTIDSDIPDVGLFGLDNWGSIGFDCHMGEVTLTGTGKFRRVVNEAKPEDIVIKKRSVAAPDTWVTGLPEQPSQ